MATWTRYTSVEINDDEGEAVCAGHVKRNGKYVALLTQTDHGSVYGIWHRGGELVATVDRIDWHRLDQLAGKFGARILPNDIGDATVIELPTKPDAFLRAIRNL